MQRGRERPLFRASCGDGSVGRLALIIGRRILGGCVVMGRIILRRAVLRHRRMAFGQLAPAAMRAAIDADARATAVGGSSA